MKNKITILQAIQILSGVCDGARMRDGVGFAACDVSLKTLSGCSVLTKQEQIEYKEILFKYKGQLGISNIDDLVIVDYNLPEDDIRLIKTTEIEDYQIKRIQKSITYSNGKIVVSFGYHSKLVASVKKLSNSRFNPDSKTWTIPVNKDSLDSVVEFLKSNFFGYNIDLLKNCIVSREENKTNITYNGNKLIFSFDYNPKIVDAIKTISGRKFNVTDKTWSCEVKTDNVEQIDRVIRECKLSLDKKAVEIMAEKFATLLHRNNLLSSNFVNSSAMSAELEVPGFKGTLMPFQKAGVKYIAENKRVIVGDEMGLGKTIEAIASIEYTNSYPAIITCPNTLKYNWEREFNRFVDRKVAIINSNTDLNKLDESIEVFVINYNALVKHVDFLSKIDFKAVVSDESHYLKNRRAKRTISFTNLVKSTTNLVLLMTGTLIVNRPNELISPLTILDKINDFGGFWGFAKRYCNARKTEFGLDISGSNNLEELHHKLRSLCYIRRNKQDVLPELPKKIRQMIEIDIDNRSTYEKAKNDLINYLKNEVKENNKFLVSISKLSPVEQEQAKKIWHETKAKNAEQAEHLVKISELKNLVTEGKMSEVVSWIEDVIESGEKLVVFADHTKTVNKIAEIFNCPKINGEVDLDTRDAAVQSFQNDPETKLIIINIKSGKEGLTLTAASKIAFIEQGWTPGEHDQAEDRIHRIGQVADSVNIYYLLAHDTIDIDIYNLIEAKRQITDAVNKGTAIDNSQLSILNELIKTLLKS